MKKVLSILAVALFTMGMVSCEADNNADETQALYDLNANAGDGSSTPTDSRTDD